MSSGIMSTLNREKVIPIARLISVIRPKFDKDQEMEVGALYSKLTRKEIRRDDFIRSLRSIAGADTIKMAVYQMESNSAGLKKRPLIVDQEGDDETPSVSKNKKQKKSSEADESCPINLDRLIDVFPILLPLLNRDGQRKVKGAFVRFCKKRITWIELLRCLCSVAGADTIKTIIRQLKSMDAKVKMSARDSKIKNSRGSAPVIVIDDD